MTVVGTAEIVAHAVAPGFAEELRAETAPGFAAMEVSAQEAGVKSGAALEKGAAPGFARVSDMGKKAFLGVGVAIAGIGIEGVKLAGHMQSVEATIAGVEGISTKAAKHIGDALLNTAGTTEYSAQEMAKAFASVAGQLKATEGHALSSGQTLKVMSASTDLASAKQIDLGTATSSVAGVMQAFGLHTKNAAHVADVLFASSNATGTSVDGLAGQLTKLRSKLGDSAGSLSQVAGLLVDMTNHGISGRAAMTGLTSGLTTVEKTASAVASSTTAEKQAYDSMSPSLQKLAKQYQSGTITSSEFGKATAGLPPQQAAIVSSFNKSVTAVDAAKMKYQNLGITVFDSQGKFKGMGSIIDQLAPKFAHMNEEQQNAAAKTIFGAGAAKQMIAVINAGPAAYDKATESVAKHGQAEDAAKKQSQTLHGEIKTLEATVSDIATEFGQVLIPVVTHVAGAFLNATKYVLDHKGLLIALAGVIGGILSVTIASFALGKMKSFADSFHTVGSAVTGLMSKLPGMEGEITAAGGAVELTGGEFTAMGAATVEATTVSETAMEGMVVVADESAAGIDAAIGSTGIGLILVGIGVAIGLLLTHWKTVWGAIQTAAKAAYDFIKGVWGDVSSALSGPVDDIESMFSGLWGDIKTGFGTVEGVAETAWKTVSGAVDVVYTAVTGTFGDVFKFIEGVPKSIATAATGLWDGLKTGLVDIINWIIRQIDHVIDAINSVSDSIPIIGGDVAHDIKQINAAAGPAAPATHNKTGSSSAGAIPHAALGAVVSSPTVLLAGEAGTEAIVPLSSYNITEKNATSSVGEQVFDYFRGKGLSTAQSAGIVGNLSQESSLNPASSGGFIAQWGGARLAGLEAYAQQQGKSVTDLSVQLQYMWKELTSTQSTSLAALRSTSTPAAAAVSFSNDYERPDKALANLPNRIKQAQAAAANYGGSSVTSSHPTSTAATDASITAWAKSKVGHFAESTGQNTGPELDKLEAEFGTRAAQWCAMFATTAAVMGGAHAAVRAEATDVIKAHAIAGTGGYEKGLKKTAKVGDLALEQGADGRQQHVGFVTSVNKKKGTYTTEEGNANGSGGVVTITHKDSDSQGFARPIYDAVSGATKVMAAGAQAGLVASKGAAEAEKLAAAQRVADTKSGEATLGNLVAATHSKSLKDLNDTLDKAHENALTKLEERLSADGTKASHSLEVKLVATHAAALAQQAKLQAAADQATLKAGLDQLAADAHAALIAGMQAIDQSIADSISETSKIASDQANARVQSISDASRITLDGLSEQGKTGADLVAAQAQTSMDTLIQTNDTAIQAAQLVLDSDTTGSKQQQATEAANLAAAQNAAAVSQAQAQATLDLDSATAQIADAAANAASSSTPTTDPGTGVADNPTQPSFSFSFFGSDISAADAFSEIGWAIKTNAIPVVDAVASAPVPITAGA